MFIYKHTETIEYVKKRKIHGQITQDLLGLSMRKFQGMMFK